MKKDCFHYNRGLRHQSANKETTLQTVQVSQPPTEESNSHFAFMVGVFQSKIRNRNKIAFALDSEASDHLININREDLASNFEKLAMPIKIPMAKNGTFIMSTKKARSMSPATWVWKGRLTTFSIAKM